MRSFVRLFFILSTSVATHAQKPSKLLLEARLAYEAKDYAACAEKYEAAINGGANPLEPAYNAACCWALLGNADRAFGAVERALHAGWRDVDHLENDADLLSLHSDSRWDVVVQHCRRARERLAASIQAPELRDELLRRMTEDQRVRLNPPAFWEWEKLKEWRRIDADNTAFMKTAIEKHGWPGKSMVGEDGALAAFLLVQHANPDVAFQKKCLPLLAQAVERHEAMASHWAYLTDRILVEEGAPQRFGTQFHDVNGPLVPEPIEDEVNVDARRGEVGLPPLSEYAKQIREVERR